MLKRLLIAFLVSSILFWPAPARAANNIVTITVTGATQTVRSRIEEFNGIQTGSDPLDVNVKNPTTSGSCVATTSTPTTGTSAATSQNNELVIGVLITGSAVTFGAGAGYTIDDTPTANRTSVEWKAVTSTGAQTATWNNTGSSNYMALLATFKATTSTPAFVQGTGHDSGSAVASDQLIFTNPVTAGDFIFVASRIGNNASTASVSDTEGNTYHLIPGLPFDCGSATDQMYVWYAYNVAGDGGGGGGGIGKGAWLWSHLLLDPRQKNEYLSFIFSKKGLEELQ